MIPDVAGVSLLAVTQAVSVYTSLLPPVSTVRRADRDPSILADVRMAEMTGTALALGTGLLASVVTRSRTPFVVSAGIAVVMVVMYECLYFSTPAEKINRMEGRR